MTKFGFETTTDEVLAGIDLRGKRVLVTGASSGLGVETARALAAHGANVVGAARNLAKATDATAAVREAADAGGGRFELVELDLADLASVRTCADKLTADGRPFDLVIANAGVMATPFGHTADGFETQFGTNFIGHFVLVNRIAPLIQDGGRVVILSSAAHGISDVDLDDPGFEHTEYERWTAYGRSKTAGVLLAVEFDRRHRGRGVRATAVHPGGIRTELQRHYSDEEEAALVASINQSNAAAGLPPFRYKTVPQGAATTVWAGVVADADAVGGHYCEDCHVAPVATGDGITDGVRPYAVNPQRAQALWTKAEEMIGESY
jgi:NAD(P)-dependent dehydrogenase (short-subunit alcohol dehydrogenase family)